jgi:hypothetical protein
VTLEKFWLASVMETTVYAFTGTFDGQGHKISNLSIHQPEGWSLVIAEEEQENAA